MSNNQILNPGRKFRPADTVLEKSDSEIDYPTLVAELKAIKEHFSGVKDSARIRMVYDNKPSSEKKRILTTRTGILIARPFRIIASRFEEASKQRAEAQKYVQKVVGGVYGEDSQAYASVIEVMTKNENNWFNRDIDTKALKAVLATLEPEPEIPEPEIPEPEIPEPEIPEPEIAASEIAASEILEPSVLSEESTQSQEFPQVSESSEFSQIPGFAGFPELPQESTIGVRRDSRVAPKPSHYFPHQASTDPVTLEWLNSKDAESAEVRRDIRTNEPLEGTPIDIHMDADDAETASPSLLPSQVRTSDHFDADSNPKFSPHGFGLAVPQGINATYRKRPHMINADVFIAAKRIWDGQAESKDLINGFEFSRADEEKLKQGAGQGQLVTVEQRFSSGVGSVVKPERKFLMMAELTLSEQGNEQEKLKKAYTDAIEAAYSNRPDKSRNCAIVLIPYFSAMSARQGIIDPQTIDAKAIAEATLEMRRKYDEKLQILVTTASVPHKDKITKALAARANTPGAEAAPIQ